MYIKYKRYITDMKRIRYVMNKAISHVYSTWLYKEWKRNLNEGNIWFIYYFSLTHVTTPPHYNVWGMGCDMRRRVDCVEMPEDLGAAMNIKRNTVQSYSTEYKEQWLCVQYY